MNKQIFKHIIRYILMIIIIAICSVIFGFSSEQGEESTSTSRKVAAIIVKIIDKNNNLTEDETQTKIDDIQYYVRKCAHFSIYAVLGLTIMGCAVTFKGENAVKFNYSIIISFLYACTDELHQRFIPGRTGQFSDVCIDTIGAFTGIIIILLFVIIAKKIKQINSNKIKALPSKIEGTKKKRNVIFIASTGGHLNELMQVKPLFKKFEYHIITEKTKVDDSLKEEYGEKIKFLIYGTKKNPITYIFKFTVNCFISLYYFFRFKPEVIVTTGTHTAVPMCYIAKMFGCKVIFIETFANRTTGTVAGKIVYPIADVFVVQWEEMHKIYPKSVCWGWLY